MMAIKDVAVSSGSACTSAPASSRATCCARSGVDDELAHSSIRFGIGRFNTEEEIDYVGRSGRRAASSACARCRPLYEMAQGRHRPQVRSSGRRTSSRTGEAPWRTATKSSTTTRTPATSARLDKDDPRRRHRPGRRAGVRRRDAAADQGQRRRRHRGRQVQDLRLRLARSRRQSLVTEWVKGKTLDEAMRDQEHRRSSRSSRCRR